MYYYSILWRWLVGICSGFVFVLGVVRFLILVGGIIPSSLHHNTNKITLTLTHITRIINPIN